ncbi:PAS domain-containing sensor histidine kinase [Paenibacillus agricola]|uniref:histidine kinase n=1 Tax=Paenibacillus agricola TaxID=2716264 RepID=A0ABX0J4Z1_9BACL|nr:PAS domain-containing sensor histidine kinase [Paenibacillus agricola]NHN30490.1 PAS domain S-box protein [Paenibacillus agricola]
MVLDSCDDVNSFSSTSVDYRFKKRVQDFDELFILISENSHEDIVTFITIDGLCQYISPSVHTLLGYDQAELLGTVQYEYLHPEDRKTISEQCHNSNGVISYRIRHKKGHYIWFETAYKTIQITGIEHPYVVCISRDITERKESETELRESEEKFRNAFDYAPIGMALVALDGHIIKVNRALCDFIGYSEQELLEKSFQEITYPDDLKADIWFLEQLRNQTLTNYNMDKRYIHKNGQNVWGFLGVSLVHDEVGQPLYYTSHIQNITDKKNLEEMKAQQEELLRRTDKISTIGQLAASIAHEIRNPLTTIRGFIQLLAQKNESDQGYFKIILDELDRTNEIISDFLALSKNRTVERKSLCLNKIIETLYPIISAEAILKGHDVRLCLDETLHKLLLDDKEIKQLLLNLLRNSMEAMEAGGKVIVKTRRVMDKVELRISDTGCGIPPDKMSQLFEPFYTTKDSGTGLGLTVCLNIVERHGGTLSIESEEGTGTSIVILL